MHAIKREMKPIGTIIIKKSNQRPLNIRIGPMYFDQRNITNPCSKYQE